MIDKISFILKLIPIPDGFHIIIQNGSHNANDERIIKFKNIKIKRKQLRRALLETLKDGLLECKIKTELENATGKEIQPSPALNASQELWQLIQEADSSIIDQEHGGQE